MVNNSNNNNNNNKTNNHLWNFTHRTQKYMAYDIGNSGTCLGQAHKWVKPVNEFPTSTLDNWISNGNTYIYIYIYINKQ
jgi:hypothetical protein